VLFDYKDHVLSADVKMTLVYTMKLPKPVNTA